jgi:XRE family transcriptional regulator, regulator of sulfur utilization
MLTRRDLIVAVIAATCTSGIVAWAQSPEKPLMVSAVFDWDQLRAAATPVGAKRAIVDSPTNTVDQLEMHVTTVKPGLRPHDPHRHPEEEVIIIKEGTLEVLQNDATTRVGPGSVIFNASNELHGLLNVGDTPATYFVIKFRPHDLKTAAR